MKYQNESIEMNDILRKRNFQNKKNFDKISVMLIWEFWAKFLGSMSVGINSRAGSISDSFKVTSKSWQPREKFYINPG